MEDAEKVEPAMRDPVIMAKKLDSRKLCQYIKCPWKIRRKQKLCPYIKCPWKIQRKQNMP